MKRKIRDLVVTLAALFTLFIMLISIDPRLRERAGELTGSVTPHQLDASSHAVTHTVSSMVAVTSWYADDNVYLFSFVIVACVLFVMMLRT